MKKSKCPSCKEVVELKNETKVQEIIICPHCQTLLELVNLFPPTLDWAEDPAFSSRRFFTRMY